jgi:hypothetical protein
LIGVPQEIELQRARLACHRIHMPKRNKQPKRPTDVNQVARYLVDASTQLTPDEQKQFNSKLETAFEEAVTPMPSQVQISLLMAELGRKGGRIGGKRRLETMTAKERKRIAAKAARARWNKSK